MDAEVERILELDRKERGTAPEYVEMLAEMKFDVVVNFAGSVNKQWQKQL